MEIQLLQLVIPGVGLISGLIATYVSLQNRALLDAMLETKKRTAAGLRVRRRCGAPCYCANL